MEPELLNQDRPRSSLMYQGGPVKKCPQCASVFVTDESCESCGLNLKFDRLGSPLDEKSFWSLKENLERKLNFFGLRLSLIERDEASFILSYKRALFLRFKALVQELATPGQSYHELDDRRLYMLELDALVQEFAFYNGEKEKIFSFFEEFCKDETRQIDLLAQKVFQSFQKGKATRAEKDSQSFFKKRFFGVLKFEALFRPLLLAACLITFALALTRYLTL